MPAIAMKHDEDPATKILRELGNIDHIEVFNDRVLVAIYEQSGTTKGGIIMSRKTELESKYQGKVCLVLKVGPMCNIGDKASLRGGELKPGDWIAVRSSDGWQIDINNKLCKLMAEDTIHMRIPDADIVW